MESIEDNEWPVIQQIFNLQLDLEKQLKTINNCINNENNDNSENRQTLIFEYLDNILENKLQIIDDFGNDLQWLNVENSLSLRKHLNGLVVVIDFFTYCCINCLHILPILKQIETQLELESVAVIGVHSPKFENEKDITNVCDALLKYNIDHPIANDPLGKVWSTLSVQCWPTLVILGPNSQILFQLIGENGIQEWLQLYTQTSLKYFERKNLIIKENKSKIPVKLLRNSFETKLLGFPSKISASKDQKLIAISNSRYHNIIICTNNGIIKHIIGGNESGHRDGSFTTARFNSPNGIVWKDNCMVFVADTENHVIRSVDINNETVITLAGNGRQTYDTIGGKIGCDQGLNSPWDLCYDDNRLFIAMAGSHQIWVLILENNTKVLDKTYGKGCCFCFAGDGIEQNRNNRFRLKASFAQPSGLALDPKNSRIYVADSESSSIRCVDITSGCVSAVVGGDRNPENLFAFGDKDGKGIECRLQHCMGIAFDVNNDCLYVSDSYNHKIKKIKISTNECISIAGNGIKGNVSEHKLLECRFNEPNGLCLIKDSKNILLTDSNNHCLKVLDLENDFINEFKLIKANEKTDIKFTKHSNETKADFDIHLDSIKFSPKNKLKLQMKLEFGKQIKATKGAKHYIEFINPDETLFTSSHKEMKIENFDQISDFLLVFNDSNSNERLNKVYALIVKAKLNLCQNDLNYCKQIKVDFHLPLLICDKKSETISTIELPFRLNEFN